MSRQNSIPPHIQQQQQQQHQGFMRANTATPPPMTNGMQYIPRQQTPQPHMISRPGSSQAIPRPNSNVGPSQLQQVSQPPNANGYTYMRTPPVQNYQHGQNVPIIAHPHDQPAGQQQYIHQLQRATQQASHQAFLQEQRRQSLPPAYPANAHRPPSNPSRVPSPPRAEDRQAQDDQNDRLQPTKNAKSRNIFTPIEDSRSLLAQHWVASSKPTSEPSQHIKREDSNHAQASIGEEEGESTAGRGEIPASRRHSSNELAPPLRSDSMAGGKRPKLKVHIPDEQSEDESGEESSKHPSAEKEEVQVKAVNENHHTTGPGVVLPPPSPSASASAILSAGASGPPNPFARPLPPPNSQQHNAAAFERNRGDNTETPISALPSRFVADGFLPSPSSFYPEWGFGGRSGGDSANILPSPLNFQTPVNGSGPSFGREDEADKKRKSPDQDPPETSAAKRVKA